MSWSAGDVGGASTVMIAEEPREGGCRRSGDRFSIPPDIDRACGCDLVWFAPVAQQCAIAATHQCQAALDQANGAVA
jgi:hypothetical protein